MHHQRFIAALSSVVSCSGAAFDLALADEIGPWTVRPATSAELIEGGGGAWGWINVINTYVSINNAFSGAPIVDDGYANADAGTIIEVVFDPPVANRPGPDLVMFDVRWDAGEYLISTDFDDFLAQAAPSVIDSGEGREYYYALNWYGPFPGDIWGGEIDFSDLDVPSGAAVARVRFETSNDAGDPLGIGAIDSCLRLGVDNFIAGRTAVWTVTGGAEGEEVAVVYGRAGGETVIDDQAGYCATFGLGGVNVNTVIGRAVTINGQATIERRIPSNQAGRRVSMQAAQRGACPEGCVSNLLTETIQ